MKKMRVMNDKPLNAKTLVEYLRSWITPNSVFFDRNQGAIPPRSISIQKWSLSIIGEVKLPLTLSFDEILTLPKVIAANTLECSGNSRSLLSEKASGNPWTLGGVGIWLRDLLARAGLKPEAHHVAFEGFNKPLGTSGIKFIRSIPIEKAMSSTMLTYEMNGEPLPLWLPSTRPGPGLDRSQKPSNARSRTVIRLSQRRQMAQSYHSP